MKIKLKKTEKLKLKLKNKSKRKSHWVHSVDLSTLVWKCFYLVWYVINPFIILILQSPHTITLMRCLSRHAHLHMSTLRVTWLVITELRSISFRLVLHAQHIYATLQLYPYNDLLHCEHSTCIIQQCIMLWMEFFHCRVWFCALSWCCAHIQCSAMILIPYGSLCAKYFFLSCFPPLTFPSNESCSQSFTRQKLTCDFHIFTIHFACSSPGSAPLRSGLGQATYTVCLCHQTVLVDIDQEEWSLRLGE